MERLREIFWELIEQGAHNIDLVSPTQFAPAIREALEPPLPVPVIWNTGGYERVETLRSLAGRVQIWLPDLKYADSGLAARLSGAPDYFDRASAAILEMVRQSGDYVMEDGLLKRGVLIRHLLLPGALENTKAVLDWVAKTFRPGQVLFSLMAQYTPQPGAEGLLRRRVTGGEYRAALRYMENLGITDGYCQDAASARRSTPPASTSPAYSPGRERPHSPPIPQTAPRCSVSAARSFIFRLSASPRRPGRYSRQPLHTSTQAV